MKSNLFTTFDQIVRRDNSSVLVQGSNAPWKVLESKSGDKTADTFDLHQHVTVKRPSKSNISDEIY